MSDAIHDAFQKVTRALEKLPDEQSKRRVIRAVVILLDYPEAVGDKPNA